MTPTPRKKSPPKKPPAEGVKPGSVDVPVTVPSAVSSTPSITSATPSPSRKKRKRGSPKGHLNLWERLYAGGKAAGVFVVTVLVGIAEQARESLPVIKQSAPIWIGILIGGLAGAVIYYHESKEQKNADNSGDSPVGGTAGVSETNQESEGLK